MTEPRMLTRDRLLQLAEPFGDLMNDMQIQDGENLAEIVTAGLYALGVALANMRVTIQVQDTVSGGLGPLWCGYMDFINEPVEKIARVVN